MRVLLTILLIMVLGECFSQGTFPQPQQMGTKDTRVFTNGTFQTFTGFTWGFNYPDTTFLNNEPYLKYTPGIIVRVNSTEFWVRNQAKTTWVQVGSGGSSTYTYWVNVEDYGAIADDGLTDTTAFKSAIAAAAAANKQVLVPGNGEYLIDAVLQLPQGLTIFGLDTNSVIKLGASNFAFRTNYESRVDHLVFVGSGRGSKPAVGSDFAPTQGGVIVAGNNDFVTNCIFKNINGAGVYGFQANGIVNYRRDVRFFHTVSFNRLDSCTVGVFYRREVEYSLTNQNVCYENQISFWERNNGNHDFIGNQVIYCAEGYRVQNPPGAYNNDHSKIEGGSINHCYDFAINFEGVAVGYIVDGVNIFFGEIGFGTVNNIMVSNCGLGIDTISVSGTATNTSFQSNNLFSTLVTTSATGVTFWNNIGTNISTYANQQGLNGSGLLKLNATRNNGSALRMMVIDTVGGANIVYYTDPPGGSGVNVYNSNGTLTSDRTITGDDKNFNLIGASQMGFQTTVTPGGRYSWFFGDSTQAIMSTTFGSTAAVVNTALADEGGGPFNDPYVNIGTSGTGTDSRIHIHKDRIELHPNLGNLSIADLTHNNTNKLTVLVIDTTDNRVYHIPQDQIIGATPTLQQVYAVSNFNPSLDHSSLLDITNKSYSVFGNSAGVVLNDSTGDSGIYGEKLLLGGNENSTNGQGVYLNALVANHSTSSIMSIQDSTGENANRINRAEIGYGINFTHNELKLDTTVVFPAVRATIPSSGSIAWNDITNPTGTQTLSFDDGELNTWTNGSNTETFWTIDNNSLTTGIGELWQTNSITTGNLASFISTSTAANAFSLVSINSSGANANSARTATGMTISVTNTGTTSVNQGLVVTTSGAATNTAISATGALNVTGAATISGLVNGGSFSTSSSGVNSDLFTGSTTGTTGSTSTPLLLPGGSRTEFRLSVNGTTASTNGANSDYTQVLVARGLFTEGTGTHPRGAALTVLSPTITNGLATTDTLVGLYVSAAPTGISPAVGSWAAIFANNDILVKNGSIEMLTAGNKLKIATGSNASIGVSGAMTAGSITISTTAVTASSKIFLVHATVAGTQGILSVGTITAGTSFVINSSNAADTGTVNWWIVN